MKKLILFTLLFSFGYLFGQSPLNIDSINIVEPSNPGLCDGTFTIYTSGGCTPYYYSFGCVDFNPANGQCCGEYPFQITDSCGTTIDDTLKWCEGVVTAINQVELSSIDIYPNPINGYFTIRLKDVKNTKIEIYNISGQLILQKSLIQNTIKIDLTDYSKGIYFVKVETDKKAIVRKIVYQ